MRRRKKYLWRQISVRLHPETIVWLEQRADAEHMPVSTLVREWIEREARRELVERNGRNDDV